MTEVRAVNFPQLDRVQRPALMLGAIGILLCVLGFFIARDHFYRSWLFAYVFAMSFTLGSFAILMLQHLTGGRWGLAIRRPLESATRLMPLMLVLFLPLLLSLRSTMLYVWTDHHGTWLNVPFFIARTAIYFAIWIAMIWLLNKLSMDQDRDANPSVLRRLQLMSGPGLVIYAITVTFAAIDWVMSLDPNWSSTIWGFLFIAGQGLSTFALMIICLALMSGQREMIALASPPIFNDLGNFLLTFTMLWAYMSFSQFLIIWSGNISEEVPYYIFRINGGWQYLALFVIVFHFAVPFLLLLSRRNKRNILFLSRLALAIIVFRLFDLYWLVMPQYLQGHFHERRPGITVPGIALHWLDVAAVMGIGGIWLTAFIWQLKQRPLLPLNDPRIAELHVHHG